jgi:hypothetical protein
MDHISPSFGHPVAGTHMMTIAAEHAVMPVRRKVAPWPVAEGDGALTGEPPP